MQKVILLSARVESFYYTLFTIYPYTWYTMTGDLLLFLLYEPGWA